MVSPFEKLYLELDDTEKSLWDKAAEVLNHGDRLYGQAPDDKSVIWWAVGLALASLTAERDNMVEKKAAAIYLEIGVDESGFWVSPIQITEQNSDAK